MKLLIFTLAFICSTTSFAYTQFAGRFELTEYKGDVDTPLICPKQIVNELSKKDSSEFLYINDSASLSLLSFFTRRPGSWNLGSSEKGVYVSTVFEDHKIETYKIESIGKAGFIRYILGVKTSFFSNDVLIYYFYNKTSFAKNKSVECTYKRIK